jgi:hypothetical protein
LVLALGLSTSPKNARDLTFFTSLFYPPISYVTTPLCDLFFIILLAFVLGLFSTYERKCAAFGFLNLANFT